MISGTRKIGALAFSVGAALSILLGWLASSYDLLRFKFVVIALAVPVALTMGGLSQLVTGVPFLHVASQWNSLQGWQRGVLGTLVVLVFSALAFGSIILFGV